MASSRRASNGRSPLVNPQRQITSFFSPRDKTTASLSISPKQNPSTRPSSTPSPLQSKDKKPVLAIGPTPERISSPIQCSEAMLKTPESAKKSYREEVVGKRIKVYWPKDECWYEGYVKSFDCFSGKHLVQYDDAEVETLELGKENIEWVEESANSFRRLKRKSSAPVDGKGFQLRKRSVSKAMVVEEKEEEEDMEEGSEGDDSEDEDWGNKVEKDNVDEDSEEVDLDEEEEDDDRVRSSKQTKGKNSDAKKRKFLGGNGKKSKFNISSGGDAGELIEPVNNVERVCSIRSLDNILSCDVAERFGIREAKKLWFLGVKERRDGKRRRPGDVDYDPRTLYLPPDFVKSLSGGQRQWWEFKSKHMDKVLFFKMGKFYELFEMDAHIGARELSLQYMKGEQPHCGFPEKNFSMNIEKLARKGFRVLVVEQTETPEQLEARRKVNGSRDKVVKREICAVVTKGTLTEGEVLASCPDASYLFAVTENSQLFEDQLVVGVCVIDASTSRFMLGQFCDDSERSTLCSLLSELRPVEIIKPARVLGPESERALQRHTRSPLVNDLIPVLEFWDAGRTVDEVRKFYGLLQDQNGDPDASNIINGSECLPDVLSELVNMGKHGTAALSAFGGCLFYLRKALLDETLLRYAKFELLPCSGFRDVPQKPYLVLDSAAIENLEIFENNTNGSSTGTLYEQLNHCVTAFGKRLLKNWLARPLYHPVSIRERQEAVAALRGDALPAVMEFRKELLRLPDMERLLARLFASSEANGRNANKVVLYEDAAKKHLQEFITALRGCQLMARACSSFSAVLNNVDSRLLHCLLTPGQGLPDIDSILNYFKDAFDWTEADNSGRIIPREGVDAGYDSACKTVKQVESRLGKHLEEQRKVLGDPSINYVTVGKELYLLEVPEGLCGSIPQDYELRSSKKGFFRYWTPQIKDLLAECSKAEAEKEASLKSILQRMIGCFCKHHIQWRQLVSATADLDALISLAIASDYYEGPSCRPTILASSCSTEVPSLLAKGLGHPVLKSDALGRGTFVPNDVCVGGMGKANFILLTGPNMGGKSTLLRQVCLAVILAQLGANVPAEQFELSPVDRIFVRMGARDHIMAGQSTFLTELSETASMLSSATRNSLVSLDELGRGTSTSDGQAIAESVLEHLVHKVNCRGMFSSHYHRLSVEYQNDSQVSLCHMACQVGKGKGGVEEVTFLYRLTPGACPKSYGVNVARLAGIPESILEKAAAKSKEFEAGYGTHREGSEVKLPDFSEDEKFAVIFRDVGRMLWNSSLHETSLSSKIRLLTEIQNQARLLLQES